jgi:hypothetical protein
MTNWPHCCGAFEEHFRAEMAELEQELLSILTVYALGSCTCMAVLLPSLILRY